jgi:hypothetical protein
MPEDAKDITAQLADLAASFQTLRKLPSHFNGGEYNELVDPSNSKKYQVMKQLGDILGRVGTKANDVLEHMGEPDEITADLNNPFQSPSLMPGPVIPGAKEGAEQPGVTYMLYYWRGRHDFLWFKISQDEEKVLSHAWYNALE